MPLPYRLPGPNYFPAFFLGKKGSLFGNDPRLDELPPETIGVVHAIPIIPQEGRGEPRASETEVRAQDFQRLETTLAEYREIWAACGGYSGMRC